MGKAKGGDLLDDDDGRTVLRRLRRRVRFGVMDGVMRGSNSMNCNNHRDQQQPHFLATTLYGLHPRTKINKKITPGTGTPV